MLAGGILVQRFGDLLDGKRSTPERLKSSIIENIKKDINKEVIKFNHNEKQIKEYLAANIRKLILKATDIKPVVFMHFYKDSSNTSS
jgi:uncharacterized FAD-dependent dehydrogenase